MKIAKFRVANYRSIEDTNLITLQSMSVLVGPNNEGKSNVLRALVVGMQAIQTAARARARQSFPARASVLRYRRHEFQYYDWTRDFPVKHQEEKPEGVSVFEFELELNERDRQELRRRTGHSLNDLLKLRVRLGAETTEVKVIKRGPANRAINENLAKICALVAERVHVEYFAAERTSSEVTRLIQQEAFRAMEQALDIPEYVEALRLVQFHAQNALTPLSDRLTESIAALVPGVRAVKVAIPRFQSSLGRNDFEVMIDDSAMTLLSAKGDGIQSLAVIALMRTLARASEDVSYILAIEEPESHLHPDAIRRLRKDLVAFAEEDQVIITTHNPILVNREEAAANILVQDNIAQPAKSLSEIRRSLGVEVPDNLQSATVVVLVEGAHDVTILRAVLARRSELLKRALHEGILALVSSQGSSNLPYQCRVQRETVARVHVVVDNDGAGRKALKDLETSTDIDPIDVTVLRKGEMWNSEIEDIYDESLFADLIRSHFNVEISAVGVDSREDFSTRMKKYFEIAGRPWSGRVESTLKDRVATFVRDAADLETDPVVEPLLGNLQRSLEKKL